MSETTHTPEFLDLQARIRDGGEDFIKESFAGMNPAGIQWVADATQAVEQAAREIVTGEGLGSWAISELYTALKSTEHSFSTEVSIDGGPVVAPPVSVPALLAIVEYYLEKHGASDQAWKHFTGAVRVGHMAQKMRGRIDVDARTATAADFDTAAQSWANKTWFWGIAAAVVGFLAGWFALIPAGVAALCIIQSVGATWSAGRLRAGTYTIPNPNNGAPNGDAQNLSTSTDFKCPNGDDAT